MSWLWTIIIIVVIIIVIECTNVIHAFPSRKVCGSSLQTWTPGGTLNAKMKNKFLGTYSPTIGRCILTPVDSEINQTYSAGQEFQFTITLGGISTSQAMKIETTGGLVLKTFTSNANLARLSADQTCADIDTKVLSTSFIVKAPNRGGIVTVQALCGSSSAVFVSNRYTLSAGPNVLPPETSGGAGTTKSSDTNYDVQVALDTKLTLFYRKNGTVLKIKLRNLEAGYIAFGVGSQMVGSLAIVGVSPDANVGLSGGAVGVHELSSTEIGGQSRISTPESLQSQFGIFNANFTKISAVESIMEFAVNLSNQDPQLRFVGESLTNLIWARGADSVFENHGIHRGYLVRVNFSSLDVPDTSIIPFAVPTSLVIHIIFMLIAFSVFAPIGMILPLFNNSKHGKAMMKLTQPSWYKYHLTTQAAVATLCVFGFFGAVGFHNSIKTSHFQHSHESFGLLLFLGVIFQMLHGLLRPKRTKTGETPTLTRKAFEYLHPFIGYFCVFGGLFNCVSGEERLFSLANYETRVRADFLGISNNFSLKIGPGSGFKVVSVMACVIYVPILLYGLYRSKLHQTYAKAKFQQLKRRIEIYRKDGILWPSSTNGGGSRSESQHSSLPIVRKNTIAKARTDYDASISSKESFEDHYTQMKLKQQQHKSIGLVTALNSSEVNNNNNNNDTGASERFEEISLAVAVPEQHAPPSAENTTSSTSKTEDHQVLNSQSIAEYIGMAADGLISSKISIARSVENVSPEEEQNILNRAKSARIKKKTGGVEFLNEDGARVLGFTSIEVAQHNKADDCYVIFKGKVYDATSFLNEHPGGKKALLLRAGKDITEDFIKVGHTNEALSTLFEKYIGDVVEVHATTDADSLPVAIPVKSKREVIFSSNEDLHLLKFVKRTRLSPSAHLFEFEFEDPELRNRKLGVPVGKHVKLWSSDGALTREYVPIDCDVEGKITFLIRLYPSGRMSNHLKGLTPGSGMLVSGPFGSVEYVGQGIFTNLGKPMVTIRQIAMLAGGTGITPMLQIMNRIANDPVDNKIKMRLLYVNRVLKEILAQDELHALSTKLAPRLSLWFSLSRPASKEWKFSRGRITPEMLIHRLLPKDYSDTMVLICGPPGMIESALVYLEVLEVPKHRIIVFN